MELLLTDKNGRKLWRNDAGEYLIDLPSSKPGGFGRSILLEFQRGPLNQVGVNGLTNEILIEVLLKRILSLHEVIPCDQNVKALYHLNEALSALEDREKVINSGQAPLNTLLSMDLTESVKGSVSEFMEFWMKIGKPVFPPNRIESEDPNEKK